MVELILVNGQTKIRMEMVLKLGQMEENTQGNFKTEKCTDMESTNGLTVSIMKDRLLKVTSMGMENDFFQMEESTKATGSMIVWKELALKHFLMGSAIMVNLSKDLDKVMGFIHGLMVRGIVENGKVGNSMVMA